MQIYQCVSVCACQFWVNLLTLFALLALLSAGQKSLGRITVRREQSALRARAGILYYFTQHTQTHTHAHARISFFLITRLISHLL